MMVLKKSFTRYSRENLWRIQVKNSIDLNSFWIPACAGMTVCVTFYEFINHSFSFLLSAIRPHLQPCKVVCAIDYSIFEVFTPYFVDF